MAMGAGLGFPVGDSAPLRFHPQPPTHKTKLKLDKEVGGGDLTDLCTNVVSSTSTQFPKFTVQAYGYAIRYVMVH